MAIYHLEAKVVSRGTGRSAVAASAYLSCTNILNDYDGVRHDYTRKKGLIWREVFLPEYAPPEWKDRGVLWNAVEENEKTKDSRLAREFVPALPVELTPTQWQELLSDLLKDFPEAKKYLEYEDYKNDSTVENASELISAIIERNADVIGNRQNFVGYMAMRPGVEKRGSHGLFNDCLLYTSPSPRDTR